ncbi:hypothetical protein HDV06_005733 [Boothiomyces sp. JEL0866]|nr:hypothetical protein HDV06_005733 [Boothiomyces sp. JEL0866]
MKSIPSYKRPLNTFELFLSCFLLNRAQTHKQLVALVTWMILLDGSVGAIALTLNDSAAGILQRHQIIDGLSGSCGYQNTGKLLQVKSDVTICMPQTACTAETCPPGLGNCVNNQCVFIGGYLGIQSDTTPWSTYYCTLASGDCDGVSQVETPLVTATKVANMLGLSLCPNSPDPTKKCVGIAASSAMIVGNSQEAQFTNGTKIGNSWGLGMTEASNLCYELTGPSGAQVVVALTDRCLLCNIDVEDIANVMDLDIKNVAHFDLDVNAWNSVCAGHTSTGSCELQSVKPVSCLLNVIWPPSGTGISNSPCASNSFNCNGESPDPTNQPLVPGTNCCCYYGKKPLENKQCA